MSWDYANKLEAWLKKEVKKLMELAASGNKEETKCINIPDELTHREERPEEMDEIKAELKTRAQARYEHWKREE